jgi:hypothetical protein
MKTAKFTIRVDNSSPYFDRDKFFDHIEDLFSAHDEQDCPIMGLELRVISEDQDEYEEEALTQAVMAYRRHPGTVLSKIEDDELERLRAENTQLRAQLDAARTGKTLLQLEHEQTASLKMIADVIDIINSADMTYYRRTDGEWWIHRLRQATDEFIEARQDPLKTSQVFGKECTCM